MSPSRRLKVLIASYLEPELVERVRDVDPLLDVVYEPTLLRPPRYAADHTGSPIVRSEADEARWCELLGEADVLFDFDQTHLDDLPELAPRVRWIQATSAGIGERVAAWGYTERMPDTVFTTASGVHAIPLAEFCLLGMLAFTRKLFQTVEQQAAARVDSVCRIGARGTDRGDLRARIDRTRDRAPVARVRDARDRGEAIGERDRPLGTPCR